VYLLESQLSQQLEREIVVVDVREILELLQGLRAWEWVLGRAVPQETVSVE